MKITTSKFFFNYYLTVYLRIFYLKNLEKLLKSLKAIYAFLKKLSLSFI